MYCRYCGKELVEDSDEFCATCGKNQYDDLRTVPADSSNKKIDLPVVDDNAGKQTRKKDTSEDKEFARSFLGESTGKTAKQVSVEEIRYTGISGWLVVIIILLVLTILFSARDLWACFMLCELIVFDDALNIGAYSLYVVMVINIAVIILTGTGLYFISIKDKKVRKSMLIYYPTAFVLGLLLMLFMWIFTSWAGMTYELSFGASSMDRILSICISAVLCIVYMAYWYYSKRVEYTFS